MKAFLLVALLGSGLSVAVAQSYRFSTVETAPGGDGASTFFWPMGVAVDDARNLYVVEFLKHSVRRLARDGVVTTLAGNPGTIGTADGVAGEARFNAGYCSLAVAVDNAGNVVVADPGNHVVRRITPDGTVTTIAGLPGAAGSADGVGGNARFNTPVGVAVDQRGNILVADLLSHTIRRITPAGLVTTLAGSPGRRGSEDGVAGDARFSAPAAVAVDPDGNVYVASYDDTVRRISPAGAVTTLAGLSGRGGYANGRGADARFLFSDAAFDAVPVGIAMDAAGAVLVIDCGNRAVRRITPDGLVTTFGQAAGLSWPAGLAVHRSGDLYIADGGNYRVVRAVPESALTITTGPQSQTVAVGGTVAFSLVVEGALGAAYQWRKDGSILAGGTGSTLVLPAVTEADAGQYSCTVSDVTGLTRDAAATLRVIRPAEAGRLVNVSVRARVGTATPALIGLTITGSTSAGVMPALLRAAGPSLGRFGVADAAADPALTLTGGGAAWANDDWRGDSIVAARGAQVGAFEFVSVASADAAIAADLAPGSFHVQASGPGAAGTVLFEIFDATSPRARFPGGVRLGNVAARQHVGPGEVFTLGLALGGQTATTLLLRAVGPSLAAFGLPGALADPELRLYSGSTLLRENRGWGGDRAVAASAATVGAFELSGPPRRDAALLVTLPPGSYTVQVSGGAAGGGLVLVEAYDVP